MNIFIFFNPFLTTMSKTSGLVEETKRNRFCIKIYMSSILFGEWVLDIDGK